MAKANTTKTPRRKPQGKGLSPSQKMVAILERLPEEDRNKAFREWLRLVVDIPGVAPKVAQEPEAPQPPAPRKLSEKDFEQIGDDIQEVLTLICAIRALARKHEGDETTCAIEALSEKAGFLADRCAEALDESVMYGSWEAWAGLTIPEAPCVKVATNAVGAQA